MYGCLKPKRLLQWSQGNLFESWVSNDQELTGIGEAMTKAKFAFCILPGLVALVLFSGLAQAQSTISGVVKDSSGAVMANTTVEAASEVLIERVRTVTTNGEGRYAIIDLRPGSYTVTFTNPG